MKNLKSSPLILLVSVISAFIQTLLLSFIFYKISGRFIFSLSILSFFTAFITSFFIIYGLYNSILFKRIDALTTMVKQQHRKEIPNTKFNLDETDSLSNLEVEVTKLVTERDKETEQTKHLDSYRKEYLGNVSHELKTPIFNIQGYISTLIDGGIYDETINIDYLKKADKSVDRMIHIIDDLETITQLEVGTMELDMERYDISHQIKEITEALEIQASKRNIVFFISKKSEKPIYVNADKFRIRQVIVNLLTNSIKYGKVGGKTKIDIDFYNEQAIIEIKDNGIGVEEKHLPRLFERFYRVDKGRSREQGGTGLGLAIVKHIIEAHGETITVTSQPQKGTSFLFTLKLS